MTTVLPEGCWGDTRDAGIAWSLGRQPRRILESPAECSNYPCIEPAVPEREHTAPISAMAQEAEAAASQEMSALTEHYKVRLRASCHTLPAQEQQHRPPSQPDQQRTLAHPGINKVKRRAEEGPDSGSGIEDSVGRKGRVPDS